MGSDKVISLWDNRGGTANEFRPRMYVCTFGLFVFLLIIPITRRIPMRIADRTLCRENCAFSFSSWRQISIFSLKLKVQFSRHNVRSAILMVGISLCKLDLSAEKQKPRMYNRTSEDEIHSRYHLGYLKARSPYRSPSAPLSCNGTNRRDLLKPFGLSAREWDLLHPLYRLAPTADSLKAGQAKNNSFIAFLWCGVL